MPEENNPKMVTAVFRNRNHAMQAIDWLHEHGYGDDEISSIMSDRAGVDVRSKAEKAEDRAKSMPNERTGAVAGGAIGAAMGAGLAAVAALGTNLVLPGLGLVISGPLAAGLAGAGAGALVGGVVGNLLGHDAAESDAKSYEDELKKGGVAIGVIPHREEERNHIRMALTSLHGQYVT
jgi:hypothetical protein